MNPGLTNTRSMCQCNDDVGLLIHLKSILLLSWLTVK